jgi:rhodanese-related sulfurtransferase
MKAEGRRQKAEVTAETMAMKAESRRQKAEVRAKPEVTKSGALLSSAFRVLPSRLGAVLLFSAFCFLPSACHTVGISRTTGGYSEISAPIAAEMILDSQQIVVIDIRPSEVYRGPEGHIAGAINAPFDTIEMHLPELLPYQNQTVLVYGETSTDGAVAAQLLTVAGFHNVVHVNGGIKEWIERGYRTVHAQ